MKPTVLIPPAIPPKKILVPTFILLVTGLALSLGILIMVFCSTRPPIRLTPLPTPEIQPSPATDPTVSWQTIQDDKYLYLVKIPSDWVETEQSADFDYIRSFTAPDGSYFEILVTANITTTLDQYLAYRDRKSATSWEGKPSKLVINTAPASIAGQPAVHRLERLLAADMTVEVTYAKFGSQVISLTNRPDPSGELDYSAVGLNYDNILNSFTPQTYSTDKILTSKFMPDCHLQVSTSSQIIDFPKPDYSSPQIKCISGQKVAVSANNRYLAYEDIVGGIDSIVYIFSIGFDRPLYLNVYGTSSIYDLLFVGTDLFILNGYPDTQDEHYLSVYDIDGIFNNISENYNSQHQILQVRDYYHSKRNLPQLGKGLATLSFRTTNLLILRNGETITKFPVLDLLPASSLISTPAISL